MAKFCTQCGTKLYSLPKFCSECGYALSSQPEPIHEDRNSTAWQTRPNPTAKHSSSKRTSNKLARGQFSSQRPTQSRRSSSGKGILSALGILYALLAIMAFINDAGFSAKRNVILVVAFLIIVVSFIRPILRFLQPWWAIQSRVPTFIRWALTFGISFYIGLRLGTGAGGKEWSSTLTSLTSGTIVGFLMLFQSSEGQRAHHAQDLHE